MSQSFWETGEAEKEVHAPVEGAAEAGSLVLSADDFASLEGRIVRAVETVKKERQARASAEERAAKAEAELREQTALFERLQAEADRLKAERDQVRDRVDRLLRQLDALEI